ncbi:hypothetical protein WN943_023097 [Citrus x changshan-huyou]
MDKSWIHESRASPAFKLGVSGFLKFAFENTTNDGRLKCPCKKCSNRYRHNRDTIYGHMICFGVGTDYLSNKWIYHGELKKRLTTVNNEGANESGNMHDMLHDAFRIPNDDVSDHDSGPDDMMGECNKVSNHDAHTFYKPLEDAEQELYPGSNESYNGQRLEELPDNFDITALVRDNMPGTVIDTLLDAAEEKSNASSDDFDSDDDNVPKFIKMAKQVVMEVLLKIFEILKFITIAKQMVTEMLLKIFQSIHKQIELIQVDFNPDGEAIAQGDKALGQYIGYLSRDSSVMPLNFDDWRHVPVDVKQEIRNLLENQMNELVNQQPNASKDQIFNQEEMNGVKSTLAEVLKYIRAQNEANAIETFDS